MKARMLRYPQMLLFPPSPALSWPSTLPFVTFPTAETSLSLLVPSSSSLAPRGGTFLSVSRFSSLLAKAGENTEQNPGESPKGGVNIEILRITNRRKGTKVGVSAFMKVKVDATRVLVVLGHLKSGLYLVATPIGNLEDITLRAIRVLRSADVILSEDTRHSGKLLQHYGIKTPLMSYHKFNESQRETTILKRLQQGNIVALISDAGTPGISDPGMELQIFNLDAGKVMCNENILVVPVPGASAFVAALSASGLSTEEFTFVGFLSKNTGSRRQRLMVSANETATQIFFVPPHKLHDFVEEASSVFGDSRQCVIAREMTKLHEEFWRGTLGKAKEVFLSQQPKGEITFLIEGKANSTAETPSDSQLEHELRDLVSNGQSLSMAVKLVSEGTLVKRKLVYALALRIFGKQNDAED